MAQGCLKCLKYTMCAVNFLCFMGGVAVLGFGIYMKLNFSMTSLMPSLAELNLPNVLLISGIVITCVSFLGFLGALKENRCLLMMFFLLLFMLMLVELTAACLLLVYETKIGEWVKQDLTDGLNKRNSTAIRKDWDLIQKTLHCCGIHNYSDWGKDVPDSCCEDKCDPVKPVYQTEGCLNKVQKWFEENFLTTGIAVIVICIIEVLGMCFAMTLYCHISRSGLQGVGGGYKL